MNVYLIKREDTLVTDYDTNLAHVVVAESEEDVKKMTSEVARDEGADMWLRNVEIENIGVYTGSSEIPVILITSTLDG